MKGTEPFFCPDEITAHVSSALLAISKDTHVHPPFDPSTEYLFNTQVTQFEKKYCPRDTDHELLAARAFDLFKQVNEHMRRAAFIQYPTSNQMASSDHRTLLRARNLVHQVLGAFDETEFFDFCKNSAGSTVGTRFADSSPEAKFKNLTHTANVDKWFLYYLNYDPQLRRALGDRLPFREVSGSNATTVPKDRNKVRMICVEPMLNMFFQQGLMQSMTARLEKVGLSFESQQDRNRLEAQLSSITGKNATIDWSSASDTLSYELVKFLLPSDWFFVLNQFRCSRMNISGDWVDLHMFSTMGNACTFPLETLVFWSLAVAHLSMTDGLASTLVDPMYLDQVMVFGDDCILPVSVAPSFLAFMRRFGFLPNEAKSFLDGRFRESCGGDFLAGQDVRPYFLTGPTGQGKTHLNAWLNIIFNRLLNRFLRIWGPLKYVYAGYAVFECLFSLFRKYKCTVFLVPTYYPDDAGIKIGADLSRFLRYYRFRDMCSKVTIDQHGSRYFSYLAACYGSKRAVNEDIRYWMAIKGISRQKPSTYAIKRRISYNVAKGISPCFLVNYDGKH